MYCVNCVVLCCWTWRLFNHISVSILKDFVSLVSLEHHEPRLIWCSCAPNKSAHSRGNSERQEVMFVTAALETRLGQTWFLWSIFIHTWKTNTDLLIKNCYGVLCPLKDGNVLGIFYENRWHHYRDQKPEMDRAHKNIHFPKSQAPIFKYIEDISGFVIMREKMTKSSESKHSYPR